jgi:hypothetical protein
MNINNIELHLYLRLDRKQRSKCDVQVNTSERKQYGGTIHLFIGTGRNPIKIIMDLSVFSSLSWCNPSSQGMSLCRSSLDHSFGMYLRAMFAYMPTFRRCFCLEDLWRRSRPPTWAGNKDKEIRTRIKSG